MSPEYLAALQGQIRAQVRLEALIEHTSKDPELLETLRLRAWLLADPTALRATGETILSPEGWPPGAHPDQAMADCLSEVFGTDAD